ncbi:type IX secretion system protein PorD [Rhodohalobacter halophilus]
MLFMLVGLYQPANAQELNCSVSVNDRQISGSSYDYVQELANTIEQYLNENRWTNDRYLDHEKINCTLQIVLTDVDGNANFTAEAVWSASRPIYNTNRQTTLFIISDGNWQFDYARNRNLIYDDLQYDDLTSFIDFYALIILGYDYDGFAELGGSTFFNRALDVMELAQNTGAAGWGRSIGAQRNRYGLISDLTNPSYRELREAFYRYHRLGLDQFTNNPEEAREQLLEALDQIRNAKRVTGNNYLFDIFFGAKNREIVAMLQGGSPAIRTSAFNILSDADPANTSEYRRLVE